MNIYFEHNGIIHIASESLGNRKTGHCIITTHLNAALHPTESRNLGEDSKTSCRGCAVADRKGCYVNESMLGGMWKKAKASNREVSFEEFGRKTVVLAQISHNFVRFGSFGNPSTMPLEIVRNIAENVRYVGYTAEWKDKPEYAPFLMASASREEEVKAALDLNFKVFKMSPKGQVQKDVEALKAVGIKAVECINSRHKEVTCRECRLCNGASPVDVVVNEVHGIHKAKAQKNVFEV